tara:strand:+ start:244 stop:645 length:402 start_codon:yes stop_codon:yes gene_type:complete
MSEAKNILIKNDLRPTSQRLAIINYILENHKIHITADKLIKHFKEKRINISLATVYNNLNDLAEKGILRKFYLNNDKMWFDTNLQDHYHFYDIEKDELIDIDKNEISFKNPLKIPKGKIKDSINIIINLKNKL